MSDAWRRGLEGASERSADVVCSGVVSSRESYRLLAEAHWNDRPLLTRVTSSGEVIARGLCQVSSFELHGDYNDAERYSLTLHPLGYFGPNIRTFAGAASAGPFASCAGVAAITHEPEVIAWTTRVAGGSGTYTESDLDALDDLTIALRSIGYSESNARVNPFCGGDTISAAYPLFRGGGPDSDTLVGFTGGEYGRATGLDTQTATRYINTNTTPASIGTDDSFSMGVYRRSVAVTTGNILIGCRTSSTAATYSNVTASNQVNATAHGEFGGGFVSSGATTLTRLLAWSRASNTDLRFFRDGSQTAIQTNTRIGNRPSVNAYVGGNNNNGTLAGLCSRPGWCGYYMGPGVGTADMVTLATAWQTYCTAMGRQI